jgi:hypothetical protein
MVIPSERAKMGEDKFEGAFVLDPVQNFYK